MQKPHLIVLAVLTSALVLHGALAAAREPAGQLCGTVVDSETQAPIADAWITVGTRAVRSARNGQFQIAAGGDQVRARAVGYSRGATAARQNVRVELKPLRVHALYLSFWGVSSHVLRAGVMDAISKGRMNAIVIDIKGDNGLISHRTNSQLAIRAGANRVVTLPNAADFVADLHRRGIYAIARIVVFKDDPLARSHPELAIKTAQGRLFVDREGLAWTDPFRRAVWDYNIAIAVEAAQEGFDEIQFDYVRFPDNEELQFLRPSTEPNRRDAITDFLDNARQQLTQYNVFLAADNFGYVCWNENDTGIGQCFSDMGTVVDYISPMLYPSSFQFGIPGLKNPLNDPYRIVFASLQRAKQRTGFAALVFRPWLQAFDDYKFDRRKFGLLQLDQQIKGALDAGASGWMLWDPRNRYDAAALAAIAARHRAMTSSGEKSVP